jgi:hypothetical protein
VELERKTGQKFRQCGSDEEQEPVHPKNPLWIAVLLQRVANGVLKKSRQSYFHSIRSLIVGYDRHFPPP